MQLEMTVAGRWRETTPSELAKGLVAVPVPWAFAGGWGLTLWANQQYRPHSDLEIACCYDDLLRLVEALPDFEIAVARSKQLTPWHQEQPAEPPYSLWLRRQGETLWDFEVVVEHHQDNVWIYRRDPRITLPISRLYRQTALSHRIIAPEVQLLYKCKAPREKDLADLTTFVPKLDIEARDWLFAAVEVAHPEKLACLRQMCD